MVLDRKLLETIAKQSGFSETDIQHAELQNPVLHSMFSLFHDSESAEPREVFRFIRRAVRHFAQNGNSIIVGRGGGGLDPGPGKLPARQAFCQPRVPPRLLL